MFSFGSLFVGLLIGVWAFFFYITLVKKQGGVRADDIINAAEKEANDIRRKADHDGQKIMDDASKQAK